MSANRAQALADLGWTDGRNVRMDLRWTGADINRIRALAHELVGLQPDIIVTTSTPTTVALQREYAMLTPSIGFCAMPLTVTGSGRPAASRIVGRMSMTWWN
jgi:hypothetical protein